MKIELSGASKKRIEQIIEFYNYKFLFKKKILDLGCGISDIGASIQTLGADITVVDAKQDHLKIINKKYPQIKTIKSDLNGEWAFKNKKFDIILDLGLLCHIANVEQHLKDVCSSTTHLVLETAVWDSEEDKIDYLQEDANDETGSYHGVGSRPTTAMIERVLTENGMNFKRLDHEKFNYNNYVYDWESKNDGSQDLNKRRIWFAVKNSSKVQFKPAPQSVVPPEIFEFKKYPKVIFKKPAKYKSADKKFVIVIPSYKTQEWCEKNITSALEQDYKNYRILYIDDNSPDNGFDKVKEIIENHPRKNICNYKKNNQRLGALHNIYDMVYSCVDDEIILTLDGDDWLPDNQVLNKLNNYYKTEDLWMTYGQYRNSNDGGVGVANKYPQHIVDSNAFRQYAWGASHLRTFYTWLFKKIKKEDLMYNGKFLEMTWDLGFMLPMLEMSGNHSKFISDILYIYNMNNPISDHRVDRNLQRMLDIRIRSMPKYSRVEAPEIKPTSVGLMFIATGKYDRYVQGVISSADKYFLKDYEVNYYVFTDKDLNINSSRKINYIKIEHRTFPYASMDRFKHFLGAKEQLKTNDYLFYCDVDSLFVDNIGDDILGELVGVQHCGFVGKEGTYENNSKSTSYISPENRKIYFGGGFSGGSSDRYLELAEKCANDLDIDQVNGIIPVYHDESIINKYFSGNLPEIILSPEYHYPQSNLSYYKKIWGTNNYRPKILLLDKNHSEMRK